MPDAQDLGSWTLWTAHGRALVAIAQDPDARMRDLAEVVGVTERTVQAIVADLETAGYVTHTRVGRRTPCTSTARFGTPPRTATWSAHCWTYSAHPPPRTSNRQVAAREC